MDYTVGYAQSICVFINTCQRTVCVICSQILMFDLHKQEHSMTRLNWSRSLRYQRKFNRVGKEPIVSNSLHLGGDLYIAKQSTKTAAAIIILGTYETRWITRSVSLAYLRRAGHCRCGRTMLVSIQEQLSNLMAIMTSSPTHFRFTIRTIGQYVIGTHTLTGRFP